MACDENANPAERKARGGVMATPEEYRKSQQQFLNIRARNLLDEMDIAPGPMIEVDSDQSMPIREMDADELLALADNHYPWKVWKVKRPEKGIAIRDYVNANTRHESTDLDISEVLRDAEWPAIDRGIRWPEVTILSSICLLVLYCLTLLK
jgi:hypothetical protein